MTRLWKISGALSGLLGFGYVEASSKYDQSQEQPIFVLIPDGAIADAAKAANASLPSFRELLAAEPKLDASPIIKTYFPDPEGGGMWLWLSVDDVTEAGFNASVFEAPAEFPEVSRGSKHFIPNGKVADWAALISGVMHGGYSLRVQRNRLPEHERASYDRYIGASSYAPLPAP